MSSSAWEVLMLNTPNYINWQVILATISQGSDSLIDVGSHNPPAYPLLDAEEDT